MHCLNDTSQLWREDLLSSPRRCPQPAQASQWHRLPLVVVLAHRQELLCAQPPPDQLRAAELPERLDLGHDRLALQAGTYHVRVPPAHAHRHGPHQHGPHHPDLPPDHGHSLYARAFALVQQ